jgi:hypothetical protein
MSFNNSCVDYIRFTRELKACILELQDLRTSELGTKVHRPHGREWRSFLVCREFVDPLAT